MEIKDDEILNLWRLLNLHDVQYIIVGGFAVNFHKFWRTTHDIDLYIEDTLENRKKLRKVFKDLELGDFEEIERIQFLPGWTDFRLNSGFRLDIMTCMKGLEEFSFQDCYDAAVVQEVHGTRIRFLNYAHLMANKKAVNRPKDQIDIIELEKIKAINDELNEKNNSF